MWRLLTKRDSLPLLIIDQTVTELLIYLLAMFLLEKIISRDRRKGFWLRYFWITFPRLTFTPPTTLEYVTFTRRVTLLQDERHNIVRTWRLTGSFPIWQMSCLPNLLGPSRQAEIMVGNVWHMGLPSQEEGYREELVSLFSGRPWLRDPRLGFNPQNKLTCK